MKKLFTLILSLLLTFSLFAGVDDLKTIIRSSKSPGKMIVIQKNRIEGDYILFTATLKQKGTVLSQISKMTTEAELEEQVDMYLNGHVAGMTAGGALAGALGGFVVFGVFPLLFEALPNMKTVGLISGVTGIAGGALAHHFASKNHEELDLVNKGTEKDAIVSLNRYEIEDIYKKFIVSIEHTYGDN